jgi:two-component system OmpR family response regulator
MARILVVEDNPLLSKLVRMGLEHAGHTVAVVEDGSAAMSSTIAYNPELILLDVLLPGASGFTVLAELKAHPATAAIPVFMLTGQSDAPSISKGLEGGADAYLSKPIDMADLLTRIAASVAHPRA